MKFKRSASWQQEKSGLRADIWKSCFHRKILAMFSWWREKKAKIKVAYEFGQTNRSLFLNFSRLFFSVFLCVCVWICVFAWCRTPRALCFSSYFFGIFVFPRECMKCYRCLDAKHWKIINRRTRERDRREQNQRNDSKCTDTRNSFVRIVWIFHFSFICVRQTHK